MILCCQINFISRQLKMKQLVTHGIPDDIRSIEFYNDSKKLEYFKYVVQRARNDENSYITAFTAMIHLEEAANSKFLQSFDLENIQLNLYSMEDQIFRIHLEVNIVNAQSILN